MFFWLFLVAVVLVLLLLAAYLLSSSLNVKCIQVYNRAHCFDFLFFLSLNFQQYFNTAWWLFLLIVHIDIQWTLWRKRKKTTSKDAKSLKCKNLLHPTITANWNLEIQTLEMLEHQIHKYFLLRLYILQYIHPCTNRKYA